MHRSAVGFLLVVGMIAGAAARGRTSQSAPMPTGSAPESLIGTWHGTSTCADRVAAPACNDEDVIYEFTHGDELNVVHWKAYKVVNGKRELMGEFDLAYSQAEKCWKAEYESPRIRTAWCVVNEYGPTLSGTGRIVPANTVVRNIVAFKISGAGVLEHTGFVSKEKAFEEGPWVFDSTGASRRALPHIDHTVYPFDSRPIRIRLDDGSTGTLRAEPRPCEDKPDCKFKSDDVYWMRIMTSTGRELTHFQIVAAYGLFQAVPVDLIGGPGDEIMMFFQGGHAVPPVGYDLHIWTAGAAGVAEIGTLHQASNSLGTMPFSCGYLRRLFSVNRAAAKPRSIRFQVILGADAACAVSSEDQIDIDAARRQTLLRFQDGKYVLR
jgi:hypothetical protein